MIDITFISQDGMCTSILNLYGDSEVEERRNLNC